MKFRALIALAVFAAGAAFAGWTSTTVSVGTPSGIQLMPDAGDFVVAGSTGATVVHCTAPTPTTFCTTAQSLVASGLVGAAFDSANNCVWGVAVTGGALNGCIYSGNLFGGASVYAVQCTQSGFCGALGFNSGTQAGRYIVTPAPAVAGSWLPLNISALATGNYYGESVIEISGVVYSAMTGPARLYMVVDAGSPTIIPMPSNSAFDTELFARNAGGLGMILTRPTAPFQLYGPDVSLGDAGGWLPISVTPLGDHLGIVSYSEVSGSQYGVGFGLGNPFDGGPPIYGPIPNPAAPGVHWELRTPSAGDPDGGLVAVDCLTPQFCVALTNAAAPPNVFVYWNAASPSGAFTHVTVTEGGDAGVTFTPNDNDGDPVFVTWVDGGGPVAFLPDPSADPHGGVATAVASLTPGAACSKSYKAVVVASDGYSPNDLATTDFSTVTVLRSGPDQPIINPAPVSFASGGQVVLTGWTDGGCPGMYTWGLSTDAGSLQSGGSNAQFTPPQYFCQPSGAATVTLSAMQAGTTLMTSAQVPIVPWGVPYTPAFLGGMSATQDAGTAHAYLLSPNVHFCADAGGFPGVVDLWSCATDAGMTTVSPDAGVVVVASMDDCSGGSVDCTVQTEVAGEDAGRLSASASLHVDLTAGASDGGPPPQFSAGIVFQNGGAQGNYSARNVPCPLRNGLTADVQMVNLMDGSDSGYSMPQSVPNPWGPLLFNGGGCVAGQYAVTARLFGPDGGIVGTDFGTKTTLSGPAEITGGSFSSEVSCADGFSKDLSVTIPDGGCSDVFVSWTQTAGPPLVLSRSTGENVTARPASPGLDGLVGQTASFTVFADGGAGNGSTTTVSLALQHHFITPTHAMVPAASNADALTEVELTVLNTEPCPVGNVMVHEVLNGLQFVSGVPDAGTGPLDIGPITLAANGSQTFRYLVRVPLLSTPVPTTTISVNGVDVTLLAPVPKAPDSCGCSSGSSLLLLAALSLWPRRRALWRRRTSRRSA
jgi:hypothetical protein